VITLLFMLAIGAGMGAVWLWIHLSGRSAFYRQERERDDPDESEPPRIGSSTYEDF